MEALFNKRRAILMVIMYVALFLIGHNIYELDSNAILENQSFLSRYAGIIANSLLAFGCFWELYLAKKGKKAYLI